MSELLGVLLICYSSRGHQLVFSYPPEPQPPPEKRHSGAYSCLNISSQLPDVSTLPDVSGNKVLGFEPQLLSDILSPKVPALCDRKFQLTVDGITFVGHATLLNADRPGSGNQYARSIQKRRMRRNTTLKTEYMGLNEIYNDQVDNLHSSTISVLNHASACEISPSADQSYNQSQITMFNLVVALSPKDHSKFSQEVELLYTHVISKMAAALKYEQLKRGYIRKETDLIMSIKDSFYQGMCSLLSGHLICLAKPTEVLANILKNSGLARSLVTLYHEIRSKFTSHIVLNHSMDISMRLPPSHARPEPIYDEPTEIQDATLNENVYPDIRPYHAILLLSDPEEILKSLPVDCSPLLSQLVQIVTPTQKYVFVSSQLSIHL